MKSYFVSDIHLNSLNERNANVFYRFLNGVLEESSQVSHLFLLGDIFDFWVGDAAFYKKLYGPLIELIAKIKNAGVQVIYFEGNHDVHVKRFWEKDLNIPCFVDAQYFEIGGRVLRLEHGDEINPLDVTYRKYRDFIRTPKMEKLAYLLPGKMLFDIGQVASRWSRQKSSVKRASKEDQFRKMIHEYAQKKYSEKPFDLIITGHMHVDDRFEFSEAGKKIESINLGSWYTQPKALQLVEGQAQAKFILLE